MPDVNELMKLVVTFRDARGWATGHTPENLAKSIIIEAAELLELFQWHPPTREIIHSDESVRERISEELADVLIYAFSFAERTGIDPFQAVSEKLKKNEAKYPILSAEDE